MKKKQRITARATGDMAHRDAGVERHRLKDVGVNAASATRVKLLRMFIIDVSGELAVWRRGAGVTDARRRRNMAAALERKTGSAIIGKAASQKPASAARPPAIKRRRRRQARRVRMAALISSTIAKMKLGVK